MAAIDPIAYWNGPVGERWTREQESLDRAFAGLTERLFEAAAIRAGERVLDVGCGCGTTTLGAVAAAGPAGKAVGVDVSAPMLARARERSAATPTVSFELGDAGTFAFEPSFDLAMSRFGVMFFAEPERAFANLRSALVPGGRLAFMCWRSMPENAWARVPYEAALRHLPPEAPSDPTAPGPFSFSDPARVKRIVEGAGFAGVRVEPFDGDVLFSSDGLDRAVAFAMIAGPTSRVLRDASDDAKQQVRRSLAEVLAPATRGGRTTLAGAVWIVRAER
jgi:SAM-dependent methyltransferase